MPKTLSTEDKDDILILHIRDKISIPDLAALYKVSLTTIRTAIKEAKARATIRHKNAVISLDCMVINALSAKIAQLSHPNQVMYVAPNQVMYATPNQAVYADPNQVMYVDPNQVMYATPNQAVYADPYQVMYVAPNQVMYATPYQVICPAPVQVQYPAPVQVQYPAPVQAVYAAPNQGVYVVANQESSPQNGSIDCYLGPDGVYHSCKKVPQNNQ